MFFLITFSAILISVINGEEHYLPHYHITLPITPETCRCEKNIYDPVCGNDGVTYSSNCMLECKSSLLPSGALKLAYNGECKSLRNSLLELAVCRCNKLYRPVCGSDGNTYNNPCMINCSKKYNHRLSIAHYGMCSRRQFVSFYKEDDIPCICNKMYLPVCGSDGKTYTNPCMLECAQITQPDILITYDGPCRNDDEEILTKANMCICTFDYKPVCGTDGKTYSNICMLNCMAKENKDIKLAYEGQCNVDICICSKHKQPVCGSNGITYNNLCELQCASRSNKELIKGHDGECTKEDNTCKCTNNEHDPLCGTDSKTYENLCLFSCARDKTPGLSILNEGECDESDNEEDDPEMDSCMCTMEYKPVCGTDSKTYSNLCILNCVEKANSDITLAYEGECDKNVCICNKMYQPICGSNGKTFANACEFECDQKWNPELKKAYNGECTNDNKPTCTCNRIDKPICGNDGKTYTSPCMLGCEQVNYPGLTIAHFGAC